MIKLLAGAILLGCVLLSSCAFLLSPQEKSKRMACQILCEKRALVCKQVCRNSCSRCFAASTRSTLKNYRRYRCEIALKGDCLALQVNSFRDPLQCRKTTCNCKADFQVCIQACNGRI